MRWKLGILMAIAALPAVAAAQQGQQQASGSQDTTHAYRSDSSGTWKSDSTGKHHWRHRHHRKHTQTSSGEVSDTTKNQTQSGVQNKSGRSTLGPGVKKTSPTQGAPVTSKGDTLRKGGDTTRMSPDTTRPQMRDTTMPQQMGDTTHRAMGDTTHRADSTLPRTP